MSFEIAGIKYCCALYGCGCIDESKAKLLSLRIPDWVQKSGEFRIENGRWNLAVGIASEDEEWRQDDDAGDFLAQLFPFLHVLSASAEAEMSLHLHYSKGGSVAQFSSGALSILAALRIDLQIEFENEN